MNLRNRNKGLENFDPAMIKINRVDCPNKLNQVRRPETSNAWHDPSVRRVLHSMQFEKCCYCEVGDLPIKGQGASVEHFWPQNTYPEKTNDWGNLLLICDHCNGNKLDNFPLDHNGSPKLIDPSNNQDNPEDHFEYIINQDDPTCGQIFGTTEMGGETVKTINLHDFYYTRKRSEIALEVYIAVCKLKSARRNLINNTPNAHLEVDEAEAVAKKLIGNGSPYAGLARFILKTEGFEELLA